MRKFTDVTIQYNKPKASRIIHQLLNTPGLMDEFNIQMRKHKLEKINKNHENNS